MVPHCGFDLHFSDCATPVFLPRESHGRRSLVGYNPRGCKESDMSEWLNFQFYYNIKVNLAEYQVQRTIYNQMYNQLIEKL